jgi:GNAT superfamily N-acetyltransferase
MDRHYHIRLAKQKDLPRLPEIERQAASRFVSYGLAEAMSTLVTPAEALWEGLYTGRLWVAVDPDGRAVGFALASVENGDAHLDELDVLPEHGRRGLGTALVETVCQWAKEAGFSAITLTTLSHIPWNAPFYRRLGFRVLQPEEYSDIQRALLSFEIDWGLPDYHRVIMCREL